MFGIGMLLNGVGDVSFLSIFVRPTLIPAVMCIGFNSLHQMPKRRPPTDNKDENGNDIECWHEEEDGQAAMDKGENYPDGKRQWVWLVLCDDGLFAMSPLICFILIFQGLS